MKSINKKIIGSVIFFIFVVFLFLFTHNDKAYPSENSRPMIAITLDDSYETDYSVAYQLLKKYNIKATSFIITSFVNTSDTYLNWDQIKEMKKYGWDVQDHTYSHKRLDKMPTKNIREELEKSDQIFKENLGYTPTAIALPQGGYNERVLKEVYKYRDVVRITKKPSNGYNKYQEVDMKKLRAYSIDQKNTNGKGLEKVKKMIDETVKNKGVLVLYLHHIVDNPVKPYTTNKSHFKEIVEYAASKDVDFVTISQLNDMLNKEQ